ncbi:MAG: hypothetical protein WCF16_08890 [Alphaproteobacteria bacterium]
MTDAPGSAPAGSPADKTATNAGAAAPVPAAPASWRDGLPDDIRAHPALANHKDVAALAKEHVNVQTLIGKKGVIPPGEKDPPEAWDKFYAALGRPEKPEGYGFKAPEGAPEGFYNTDMSKAYSEAAHKAGLSAKQAAALHDWFVGASAESLKTQQAKSKADDDALDETLRKEFGTAYGKKIAAGKAAAAKFLDVEGLDKLEAAFGGAGMIRFLSKIGEAMGEDALVQGATPKGTMTPEEAKAEIAKLRGEAVKDPKHALNDRMNPEHGHTVARLEQLYKMAYPGEADVSRAG